MCLPLSASSLRKCDIPLPVQALPICVRHSLACTVLARCGVIVLSSLSPHSDFVSCLSTPCLNKGYASFIKSRNRVEVLVQNQRMFSDKFQTGSGVFPSSLAKPLPPPIDPLRLSRDSPVLGGIAPPHQDWHLYRV